MKHTRLFVAAVVLMVGLGGVAPLAASADTPQNTVCQTLDAGPDCKTDPPNSSSLNKVLGAVVNILSYAVGLVAVIMLIVGGFRYVTSGGDSGKLGGAKNTIIYALVGLVVVVMAQTIVRFVLQKVK